MEISFYSTLLFKTLIYNFYLKLSNFFQIFYFSGIVLLRPTALFSWLLHQHIKSKVNNQFPQIYQVVYMILWKEKQSNCNHYLWIQQLEFKSIFIFRKIFKNMTASTRDEWIYMAKITEQTERFEDMLEAMNKVVAANADLSVEERNLLSVAYKNTIGSRRTAWRALSSIEKKEEQKGSKNLGLLKGYKAKIEGELNKYCHEILALIDTQLIAKAANSEAKVFYHKMKGDYYRYISEYTSGSAHDAAGKDAHEAYKAATLVAEADLKTTHPIRLGLALNYSVFFYEVKNDPGVACQLAKKAFDDAIADIDQIEQEQYKDATTIMQLIRDNLTLWTSELEEGADN